MLAHGAELVGERVDVVFRRGKAQLHHRPQPVVARRQACLWTQALDQRERVIDVGCPLVAERRRNLQDLSLDPTWTLLIHHFAGVTVPASSGSHAIT